ncbi:MAG: Bax inhibitor-1 family protein [Clostridia bacterium]
MQIKSLQIHFLECFRLLASALTAFYVYKSGLYVSILNNGSYIALAIAEIAVVIIFSLLFKKLSPAAVTILFIYYAFINGLTLSVIFVAYEMSSITYAFAGTAVLFGILSLIGYKTDKDISNWGTIVDYSSSSWYYFNCY